MLMHEPKSANKFPLKNKHGASSILSASSMPVIGLVDHVVIYLY